MPALIPVGHDDGRHGIVALEDPQDDTPMFDLRLAEASRGRGIGTATLLALAHLVFSTIPQAPVIGVTTCGSHPPCSAPGPPSTGPRRSPTRR